MFIGNIKITDLYPQTFEIVDYDKQVKIEVDGKVVNSNFAKEIDVKIVLKS